MKKVIKKIIVILGILVAICTALGAVRKIKDAK